MRQLMSRYGGHGIIVGQGKASDSKLPEDQSLDNLLDNYATEVVPNTFYISSYDARPEWMGPYEPDVVRKLVKIGTLEHDFNEILTQYSFDVESDVFVGKLKYSNVFTVHLRTKKNYSLECTVGDIDNFYDLVLVVFFRDRTIQDMSAWKLSRRPDLVKKILIILCAKMGLTYEGDIIEFLPSRTHVGKTIDAAFAESLKTIIEGVDTDERLADVLTSIKKEYPHS